MAPPVLTPTTSFSSITTTLSSSSSHPSSRRPSQTFSRQPTQSLPHLPTLSPSPLPNPAICPSHQTLPPYCNPITHPQTPTPPLLSSPARKHPRMRSPLHPCPCPPPPPGCKDCSGGTMFPVIADHVEDGCTRAFSIAIFSASTSMSYYHSDQ
jgi:hypothetical protein